MYKYKHKSCSKPIPEAILFQSNLKPTMRKNRRHQHSLKMSLALKKVLFEFDTPNQERTIHIASKDKGKKESKPQPCYSQTDEQGIVMVGYKQRKIPLKKP